MVARLLLSLWYVTALVSGQRYDGQFWPCNPTQNATGACAPAPGWPGSTYEIDFTKQTSLPKNWTIANYETVSFGSNGAEFTFNKRGDAPQMWTNFFVLGCRYEITMQVAPGIGIISSSVMISDAFDEIDLEFSGNNFGFQNTGGNGQTNYFGKGITGAYDRGMWFNVTSPMAQFHTYYVDWNQDRLIWGVDGNDIRQLNREDCDNGTHQYPQSPSKLQIGLWDGGDPDGNYGTVSWAGGYTDLSKAPYTFFVKSIQMTNYNPAQAYNYTDQSGSWESIKLIQDPEYGLVPPLSTTSTSITPKSTVTSSAVSQSSVVTVSEPVPPHHLPLITSSAQSSSTSLALSATFTSPAVVNQVVLATSSPVLTTPAGQAAVHPSLTSPVASPASSSSSPTPTSTYIPFNPPSHAAPVLAASIAPTSQTFTPTATPTATPTTAIQPSSTSLPPTHDSGGMVSVLLVWLEQLLSSMFSNMKVAQTKVDPQAAASSAADVIHSVYVANLVTTSVGATMHATSTTTDKVSGNPAKRDHPRGWT